ncbi:MAG: glycosyltransferase (TIGR04182 family), partial [Haloarculaceae archaeon]
MAEYSDVCVLIPTYNEAETIGEVIDGYRAAGLETVLVIDGGSEDGTQAIAEEHGARVVEQSGSGKGQAVREAIGFIEKPYILMVDGDATYDPGQADRMLEPLLSGEADHVIGNRFADMESGAMSRLNRIGNRIINRAFRFIHGRDLVDILSGYRAYTRKSAERVTLSSDGFGIETEFAVECVKHGVSTAVVPITYRARPEESETNLRPFRDGAVILLTLYQMAKTNNPLFYFGSVGTLSTLVGVVLGAYVAIEWFTKNTSHEVLALLGGISIVLGIQLLMFGVLSDLIVAVNR